MWRYIGRRLLEVIPTTFGILLLTFVLFNVVSGGSPAATILGKGADEKSIAAFNKRYGYDKPLLVGDWRAEDGSFRPSKAFDSQFFNFLKSVATGDLGYSSKLDEPVADVLKRGVGPSLSLTVPILFLGVVFALFLALLSAAYRGRVPDRIILFVSAALMSVNYVVWVVAGQYFLGFKWAVFPLWGYENWTYLALPVLIGVVSGLGSDVRFYRTVLLDEMNRPHVRTALAKGLSPAAVLFRHVLRNSLVPVVTNVSLAIPFLFTGSILLESFFGLPGLGGVGINAVHSSDAAMLRAVVLIGAALYQVAMLLADLAYAALDPRVRL